MSAAGSAVAAGPSTWSAARRVRHVVPPATATRLLQIMEHLPEVSAWHASLNDQQQVAWASPSAVFKHCPVFANSKTAAQKTKPTPLEKARAAWDAFTECLKVFPKEQRAVEVAQFMADVRVFLPDLIKARESLGYREKAVREKAPERDKKAVEQPEPPAR